MSIKSKLKAIDRAAAVVAAAGVVLAWACFCGLVVYAIWHPDAPESDPAARWLATGFVAGCLAAGLAAVAAMAATFLGD